ncbi:hypothetical protein [Vibrio anguillarum]|uniref:hypothetical protein n=3 Tax=Vibrio anguillarum TaxID=55601 RepID=UPI00188D036B|nr:hypothetical protein [Vibrio anguillarum]
MKSNSLAPMLATHDADIVCGFLSFQDLRDIYEVSSNGTLQKHEYKIELVITEESNKELIDVDVYVTHQSSLQLDLTEVIEHSNIIDGLRCAHLAHLLLLKIDTYTSFINDKSNTESLKFTKIVHDILQIVGLLTLDQLSTEIISKNINEQRLTALLDILSNHKLIYSNTCKHFSVACFTATVDGIKEACA